MAYEVNAKLVVDVDGSDYGANNGEEQCDNRYGVRRLVLASERSAHIYEGELFSTIIDHQLQSSSPTTRKHSRQGLFSDGQTMETAVLSKRNYRTLGLDTHQDGSHAVRKEVRAGRR